MRHSTSKIIPVIAAAFNEKQESDSDDWCMDRRMPYNFGSASAMRRHFLDSKTRGQAVFFSPQSAVSADAVVASFRRLNESFWKSSNRFILFFLLYTSLHFCRYWRQRGFVSKGERARKKRAPQKNDDFARHRPSTNETTSFAGDGQRWRR